MAGTGTAGEITRFSLQSLNPASAVRRLASLTASLPAGIDHIVEDSPDLIIWHRVSPLLRPASGVLDWSHAQYDGDLRSPDLYASGTSNWRNRRFYRVRPQAAADPAPVPTGSPVSPAGRLTQPVINGPYRLLTQGNWSLVIEGTNLKIRNPAGTVSYEFWGTGSGTTCHENLNGKHLKDTLGGPRTMLLPDGTIITVGFSAQSQAGTNAIDRFSIYDGDQSHRLTTYPDGNGNPNTLIMSALLRRAGESAEPDGETGRILDTPKGAYVENIYTQSTPPTGAPIPQSAIPLGRTGGPDSPNLVNDFFDDPRLGHT